MFARGRKMTDIQQSSAADLPEATKQHSKTTMTHEKATSTFKKKDHGILEHKIHPIANLFKRSLKAGSIHPMSTSDHAAPSIEKAGSTRDHSREHQLHPQHQQQNGSETTTTQQTGGMTLDPEFAREAISTYLVALAPALMTFYRVFFGNNGPTWFSFRKSFYQNFCLFRDDVYKLTHKKTSKTGRSNYDDCFSIFHAWRRALSTTRWVQQHNTGRQPFVYLDALFTVGIVRDLVRQGNVCQDPLHEHAQPLWWDDDLWHSEFCFGFILGVQSLGRHGQNERALAETIGKLG